MIEILCLCVRLMILMKNHRCNNIFSQLVDLLPSLIYRPKLLLLNYPFTIRQCFFFYFFFYYDQQDYSLLKQPFLIKTCQEQQRTRQKISLKTSLTRIKKQQLMIWIQQNKQNQSSIFNRTIYNISVFHIYIFSNLLPQNSSNQPNKITILLILLFKSYHWIYTQLQMKANVTLLLAVLFALVFYTSSLKSQNQPKAAAPSAAPTVASKQNTKKNIPNPKNSPAKPATQVKKSSQPASPAKPAPVKLCAFNKIGMVPGSPIHKFSVLELQSSKYENKHFDVAWREQKNKHHKFFTWIQKQASFSQNFPKMKCQVADKAAFGKTCNYQPAQLDQFYANAFGKDIIFKCVVPDNSFVLTTRFVLQLSDFATSAGGRWSVFAGLYQFNSAEDAKKTIQKQAKSIRKEITSSQLSTFDINSNLNIIPQFVKGTLSWIFSSNINSNYHRTVKKNNPYDLSDVGYVKILPPGTEFIIGSIYNGTTSVKQICDNYRFDDVNDDCRLKI